MTIHLRADRTLFRVTGADAGKLLHDTLTGHVEAVPDQGHWWALLTPQGKVIAEGLLGWADDSYWLDVHDDGVETFVKMMRLYKMRADMQIEDVSAQYAVGWSDAADDSGIVHADSRGGGLGFRVISAQSHANDWSTDVVPYAKKRISKGVVEVGADYPASTLFPHDAGMDFNDGIDFKKGCYIGQEVVSRMKHRGTARRRPVIVSGVAGNAGDSVTLAGRSAGQLGQVVDKDAVAILRIDRVSDPALAEVNDQPVRLALPVWASYRFGDSGGA